MSESEARPKLLAYRSPRENEAYTQYLGMVIFLCAWAMLFCGVFLAYGVIRTSEHPWPPTGAPRLPLGLGALNLLLIGAASFAFHLGTQRVRRGLRKRAALPLLLALALGAIFLAVQAATWLDLHRRGLILDGGPYAGFVYFITGFQALQLVFGEGALAYIAVRVWRGTFNAANLQPVRLWGMYWHSIAGSWVCTFVALYLF